MKPYKLAEYRYLILKSGKSRIKVVYKILACCTYEEILYYVKNTPAPLRGVFKYNLQFLKCETYGHVYKQPVGFLKDPLDYVGLMAYIFPLFRNEINDFVHKRIIFVRNYLLGDFETCSQIIDSVNLAQVRKSVDSPAGMLTEDHHHTVHEESQVCYSSHLRPKSLHL